MRELSFVRRQLTIKANHQKQEAIKIITNINRKPVFPFKKIEITQLKNLQKTTLKTSEEETTLKTREDKTTPETSAVEYSPQSVRIERSLQGRFEGKNSSKMGYF